MDLMHPCWLGHMLVQLVTKVAACRTGIPPRPCRPGQALRRLQSPHPKDGHTPTFLKQKAAGDEPTNMSARESVCFDTS